MRLSLFFILFTLLALVLAQQQEEEQEREPEREPEPDQEQQDQPPTGGQQVQQRPTGNQQTEEQQSNEQQSGNQLPTEQQSGGLKNCKATGTRPGPNAIVLAPGLSVEFDAESKDITNVTFQAAPGWSPDSLSSCTVRAGRELPSSGKKVQCANGGIAFGVIQGDERLLVHNLRRSNAELVEPPTFQLDFVMINETNTLVGCKEFSDTIWGIGILNKDCRFMGGSYVCTSNVRHHGELTPVRD